MSLATTSFRGKWMVTGTTASSGDHSIITGCAATPVDASRKLGEILGVSGLGEAGAVEHVLGDRIGDDRAGGAGADVGHGAVDGGERRRRARLIRSARLGADRHADVDNGQRGREGRPCRRRLDHRDGQIGRDRLGAPRDEFRIGEQIEGSKLELGAPAPRGDRDVGSDSGRLAERQRQRPWH